MDPLEGSRWSAPGTVEGFGRSPPNEVLMRFIDEELERAPRARVLDVGCGAGRNGVPMARAGCRVLGTDLSWPMLRAAAKKAALEGVAPRTQWALAPMERLPAPDRSFDVIVAHGIWNLARSGVQLRGAIEQAARVARPGAGLFVFTFSRHTLAPDACSVPGEPYVFTQFAGEPQCFLAEPELVALLGSFGFEPRDPLTEYNRPVPGQLNRGGPVIYEGTFRFQG
jgi:SAM-dependent methyltransferase